MLLLESNYVLGHARIHVLLKCGIVLGRHHTERSGGGGFSAGTSLGNVRNNAAIRPKSVAQHVGECRFCLVLHLLRARNVRINSGRSNQRLLHDRGRSITRHDDLLRKTSSARRYRLTLRSRLTRNDSLLGLLALQLHLKQPMLLLPLHLKPLLLLGWCIRIYRELTHHGGSRWNRTLLCYRTQPGRSRPDPGGRLPRRILLLNPLHLLLLVQTLRHRATVDDLLLSPNAGRHSRTNLKRGLLLLLLLLLTLHQHALFSLQPVNILLSTRRIQLLQRSMRLRVQLYILPLNLRSQRRPDKLRLPGLTRNGRPRRHNSLLNNRRPRRNSTLRHKLLPSRLLLLLNRTLRRPLLLLLNQLSAWTRLLLNNLTAPIHTGLLNLTWRRRPYNLLLNYRWLTRLLHHLLNRSTVCTQRLLNNLLLLRLPTGNRLLNYQLLLLWLRLLLLTQHLLLNDRRLLLLLLLTRRYHLLLLNDNRLLLRSHHALTR